VRGRRDPQQQRERGDGEHRAAHPARGPQRQEDGEVVRQAGQAGGDRDDDEARGEHHPLAEPLDQRAAAERRHEPEEGEGADGQPDGRRSHAERAGEQRDGRRDDPEAERHHEGDDGEHPDLAGELSPPEKPHGVGSSQVVPVRQVEGPTVARSPRSAMCAPGAFPAAVCAVRAQCSLVGRGRRLSPWVGGRSWNRAR
jgi:hypothetical protein